jgi:four helix bundle protein
MARDHRKLEVFQLADDLAMAIYQATSSLPSSERFGIQSQLRRAAVSIPTNIVEGCARDSERDFVRSLDIAFGSSRELLYLISLAQRLEYMDSSNSDRVEELGRRTAAALAALKKSISVPLRP